MRSVIGRMKKYLFKLYKSKLTIILCVVLLLFPLVVDLFYHISCKFFYLEESDLLAFYGVAGGLFFSFLTYRKEKHKEKESHNGKIKPCFFVDLKLVEDEGCFELEIIKQKNVFIGDVFIYDKLLDNFLKSGKKYKIDFYPDNEKRDILNVSSYDKDLIDKDGYPKYILISCCDSDNRMWQGEYIKLSNGQKNMYVLKDMYLV